MHICYQSRNTSFHRAMRCINATKSILDLQSMPSKNDSNQTMPRKIEGEKLEKR